MIFAANYQIWHHHYAKLDLVDNVALATYAIEPN